MEENQGQSQVVAGRQKRAPILRGKKGLWLLVLIASLVFAAAGVAITQLGGKNNDDPVVSKDKGDNSAKVVQDNEVRDSTTITSQASMIKIVLGIFKMGGSVNGTSIASRGFYPSTADMKNASWLVENMQIEADTHELIESGAIVYESKGCKSDQPSGEKNKCNDFILRVGSKVVAEGQ